MCGKLADVCDPAHSKSHHNSIVLLEKNYRHPKGLMTTTLIHLVKIITNLPGLARWLVLATRDHSNSHYKAILLLIQKKIQSLKRTMTITPIHSVKTTTTLPLFARWLIFVTQAHSNSHKPTLLTSIQQPRQWQFHRA